MDPQKECLSKAGKVRNRVGLCSLMLVGLWETEEVGTVPESPSAGNQLSIRNVQVCACMLTGVLGMKPHGTEQIIFDYRYTD